MYITEMCFCLCWDVFMHCCPSLQNGCEWARNVLQKIQENLWPFCAAAFRHSLFLFLCANIGLALFFSDEYLRLRFFNKYIHFIVTWIVSEVTLWQVTGKLYWEDKLNISSTLGNDTDFSFTCVFVFKHGQRIAAVC